MTAARARERVEAAMPSDAAILPELLTLEDAASFLRTTRKAAKMMVDRGTMPGVVRIGRRILVRRDDLRRAYGLLPSAPANGSPRKATHGQDSSSR